VASPASTNVVPAGCTCGVQVGSFPSYSVAVPEMTITRLGPVWLCQPKVPPGATVFWMTYRCEGPLVLIMAFQKSLETPGLRSVLANTSMSSNVPFAIVTDVTPDCGVA